MGGGGFTAPGWVDLVLLGLLFGSTLLGVFRGLLLELMALAGWMVAYFTAGWVSPRLAPLIPIGAAGGALNHCVAFLVVFVATLIGWGLVSRLVSLLVKATPLTVPDRVLGAVFGLARAGVLWLAVATVVSLTPAAQARLAFALWRAHSATP